MFLPGDWDPAGFFDRVVARAGGFFGVAFRGTRAATGAAASTRLRGRSRLGAIEGPGHRVGRDRLDIEPILLGLFFQLESVLSFDGLRIQRV